MSATSQGEDGDGEGLRIEAAGRVGAVAGRCATVAQRQRGGAAQPLRIKRSDAVGAAN
jgi:hypothetical protein